MTNANAGVMSLLHKALEMELLTWDSFRQKKYCKTSNISRASVAIKIVDHSDVVGASPAGAAPTYSFST